MKSQNSFLQKIAKITPLFLVAVLAFSFVFGFSNQQQAFARRRRDRNEELAELQRINNNIVFSKFDAKYIFKADQKGNTFLYVVENISADFTSPDVNHGIERAIPKYYNGKTVFDDNFSVKMDGGNIPYSVREDNGNLVYRIGDANSFVSGKHIYQITYRLKNILRKDGNVQKLTVNTNGLDWKRDFGEVSAKVELDNSVLKELNGEPKCYAGSLGVTNQCRSVESNSQNNIFSFSQKNVGVGENLTFEFTLNNKFAQPDMNFLDITTMIIAIIMLAFLIAMIIFAIKVITKYNQIKNENSSSRSVVPQYLPPKFEDFDILDAGNLINSSKKLTAAILFFAVNGNILIKEDTAINLLGREYKEYKLQLLNKNNLNQDMIGLLDDLFEGRIEFNLSQQMNSSQSMKISQRVVNNSFSKTPYYVQEKQPIFKTAQAIGAILMVAMIGALFGFGWILSLLSVVSPWFIAIVVSYVGIILLSAFILTVSSAKIPSRQGSDAKNYLEGLKLYISVAEKDRLEFSQSLQNSERFQTEFGGSRVKLYEKLLPWAALFGLEKSWAKVLEVEFTDNDYMPGWYIGVGAFNATAFSDSLDDFSDVTNDYSSSSSGSSGGGGGFSGGGAGGGGGGGW